jgi:hypothetical protein
MKKTVSDSIATGQAMVLEAGGGDDSLRQTASGSDAA